MNLKRSRSHSCKLLVGRSLIYRRIVQIGQLDTERTLTWTEEKRGPEKGYRPELSTRQLPQQKAILQKVVCDCTGASPTILHWWMKFVVLLFQRISVDGVNRMMLSRSKEASAEDATSTSVSTSTSNVASSSTITADMAEATTTQSTQAIWECMASDEIFLPPLTFDPGMETPILPPLIIPFCSLLYSCCYSSHFA